VNLSKFVRELFELSGMSEQEFCTKLKLTADQFDEIKAGTNEQSAGIKTLMKAVSAALFAKQDNSEKLKQDTIVHNKLTQAHAIIVTVSESEHLAEHEQTTLSVASEFIDDARQRI